ncbi:MAG: PH domain-containing protein [Acidimicrobiia bacterium]|nr:PH domain-containing protein [Acidimicrobiia bacterium]
MNDAPDLDSPVGGRTDPDASVPDTPTSPGDTSATTVAVALDGSVQRLDPRIRRLWVVAPGIPLTLIAVAVAVVALVRDATGLVVAAPFVVLAVMLVLLAVWAVLRWRCWRWSVWPDAIELSYGVIVRTESLVPFHRIQQIDIRRGPLERLVGLASLEVHTAAATSDAWIPAVDEDLADPLRRALLERAGVDDAT